MIKIASMAQAQALSMVLDTEAGADGGINVSQQSDGTLGVSRMTKSQKIERHTWVMKDGDTKEVDLSDHPGAQKEV